MENTSSFATYPSLRNRVAVVTGGASGIGEAIVEALAAQHTQVVFLDHQVDPARHLVDRIRAAGLPPPIFHACDLTDIDVLQHTAGRILAQFPTVHILVNNAGNDTRHAIQEVTSESWDRSMAINLKQQFFTAQALLPSMQRAGGGSIINMGSISWVIPSTGLPVYVTAKAAIVGLTRTLAHELGPDNIRVNCVMPGAILTERQKRLWLTDAYKTEILARQALKRLLLPAEVARLVLFLAADDSAAITNQSYVIDAGWT